MRRWGFFVFTLVCLQLNGQNYGLEQTRLNANTANANLLLSESGRDPSFGTKPGFQPLPARVQPQASTTNIQSGNGQTPGRVHDLVNFYNDHAKATSAPLKPPSYSSIVSGTKPSNTAQGVNANGFNSMVPLPHGQNNGNNPAQNNLGTGSTRNVNNHPVNPTTPSKPPTRPSFSEILSGGNRSPSPAINSNANQGNLGPTPQSPLRPTTKPSFSTILSGGTSRSTAPTSKPSVTPVLPSTIVSNNVQGNRNAPTDLELQTLSEELLRKDTNNAAKLITINYQDKTTSQSKDDKAPLALFTIPDSVYNIPTVQKFLPLLDNYERDTLVNEYVTPQERNEENAFMDAIMQTQVIRQLMTFLKDKGYVTPDPRQQRDFLKQLWFSLYSRGRGKISSSGFEHIFVSELKNGEVSGLHNWLYFAKEESANRANYLGYLKYEQFGEKGAVIKLHFTQQGTDKPVDSMFAGTSPELEIALYSLCFVTRADRDCLLKLGGKSVKIITHTFRYRSKNMIGSAYPQI